MYLPYSKFITVLSAAHNAANLYSTYYQYRKIAQFGLRDIIYYEEDTVLKYFSLILSFLLNTKRRLRSNLVLDIRRPQVLWSSLTHKACDYRF